MVLFDGSMATMVAGEVADRSRPGWCELHCYRYPDTLRAVHDAYIQAGCDVIKTCTFGVNSVAFHDNEVCHIINQAVAVARERVWTSGRIVRVAGDIGPIDRRVCHDVPQLTALYGELVKQLVDAGVDIVYIESVVDEVAGKCALEAALKYSQGQEIMMTAIPGFVKDPGWALEMYRAGANVVGYNCGTTPAVYPSLASALERLEVPYALMPPVVDGDERQWQQATTEILCKCAPVVMGGCCGTTPQLLKKFKKLQIV